LQPSAASAELELWKIHSKHISKVCNYGKKSHGLQVYHPMLMNWAIAFLACILANTYNKVAKIMMMPHISTIYRKMAELIAKKK
jgi:hypothetical protein